MSRDGGGVYSIPAGSVFTNATVIDEVVMNALIADIASDLNVDRPVVAGGTGGSTAAAARTNLGVQAPLLAIDTTGSSNAYILATARALTPSNGDLILIVANFAVTSSSTINVDATGNVAIKKVVNGTPTDTATGDIYSAGHYILVYDSSASAWIILNHDLLTSRVLASPLMTTPRIQDSASDHKYIFASADLAADRTISLPLLTGNDTFLFNAFAATLTNKTFNLANNTLTSTLAQLNTALSDANLTAAPSPETVKATTSGTTSTYSSIAAGKFRITCNFSAIGHAAGGGDRFELRLGDSSGIDNSGYLGGVKGLNHASGFVLHENNSAAHAWYGCVVLNRIKDHVWTIHGSLSNGATNEESLSGHHVLTSALTDVQLTTTGGATFDAGEWGIMIE